MKLYICYGTFKPAPRPGGHRRGNAHHALKDAGHKPELIKTYGWAPLRWLFNLTPGRREVKRLTGNYWVPVLVVDDGEVIQDSQKIMDWAQEHPAVAAGAGQ